eukprot:GHVT01050028.1.p1 GENE.GHVT01050028.1~~GHVT01050028.1.p1  ORF type:complete len:124 (-),score=8.09 GHVT01050028.1:456-827(-)
MDSSRAKIMTGDEVASYLTDDILDAHLGRQWRQARPVTLSFSRPEFRLMGLGDGEDEEDTSANSKTPSKNGLLALSRSKLKHLDLSNNLLTVRTRQIKKMLRYSWDRSLSLDISFLSKVMLSR